MAPKKVLALTDEYAKVMGIFQGNWASLELTTDYAIGKFLNIPPQEAHLITSGLMFGRKARLLAALMARSDHPKKAEVLGAFNKLRGMSKRDIFAHSYIRSNYDSVTFLDRSTGGDFKATEHTFTLKELTLHIAQFVLVGNEFYEALGATKEELNEFARAALSLNRKSKTSPGEPSESA